MEDTTQQSKTQEKNSDVQVLGIEYFYKKFNANKRAYHPALFAINKTTHRKQPKQLTFKLYRKIITDYLTVYFLDFYLKKYPIYFPLGGLLKKVVYPKWVRLMRRGSSKEKQVCGGDSAIGLFWYLRPSKKMFHMITLKKQTGKHNRLPKIERLFSENYDKDLLPIFTDEARKSQKHKTLYLCTLT